MDFSIRDYIFVASYPSYKSNTLRMVFKNYESSLFFDKDNTVHGK